MYRAKYILLIFIMLVGCNNQNQEESYTYIENQTKEITLYYGTIYNKNMIEALTEDFYNEKGIQINWLPADSGPKRLKELVALDQVPDAFTIGPFDLEDWSHYLYDLSDQSWVDDVYENAINEATVDGALLAWPHALEASGIVYNKKIFESVGIQEVPRTKDALIQVCELLESQGYQSFGESWMEFGYLAHTLAIPFTYEENLDELIESLESANSSFSNLIYIDDFFDFFDLTLRYGLGEDSLIYNTLDQYPDFVDEKMVMMKQGTWVERNLSEMSDSIDIGIFPVPLSNDRKLNRLQVTATTFLCVHKESEHLEETLELLEWWHERAEKYLVELDRVEPPFYSVDTSDLGSLYGDMNAYINNDEFVFGFGYEKWPAGFQIQIVKPLHDYVSKGNNREKVIEELTDLFND